MPATPSRGTPLAYYYAKIDPITQGHLHPMAAAMDHIGYDAAALGNHEFNYGLDVLRTFEKQLDFPLLGANATHRGSGNRALTPCVIHTVNPTEATRSRSASWAWSLRAWPSWARPTCTAIANGRLSG